MENMLEIVYFHLYKYYYKDGKYANSAPWFAALCALTACLIFYSMSLLLVIEKLVGWPDEFPLGNFKLEYLLGLSMVILILLHFSLARNKQYLVVYEKYRHKDTLISAVLSWIFVLSSLLVFMIVVVVTKEM